MKFTRFNRKAQALMAAGLVSTASIMAGAGPVPIEYWMLASDSPLKANLDACFGSCHAGAYSACYVGCQTAWGACWAGCSTCDAGCDTIAIGCEVPCFFDPSGSACQNCLAEVNNCRASCDACRASCNATYDSCIAPCVDTFADCHLACANNGIILDLYQNGNVGKPWFCGAPRDPLFQFGTLDYPYAGGNGFQKVLNRWDANPKTIYIASGTEWVNTGGPLVINHPTWLVNNTPQNGPVLITR